MNLVASMVIRNEMERYLPLAVSHLLGFCDSIAVLDDASNDGSLEWLMDHDERKRIALLHRSAPGFFAHEGRTRQQLYNFTLEQKPTHILSIDCDELVSDPDAIRRVCEGLEPVYTLGLSEVWKADANGLYLRVDGLWKERRVPILFRPQPGWKIRDRKKS